MLINPKNIPIQLRTDNFSLNINKPTKLRPIRLSKTNIEPALDINSYLKENAQNSVPIRYIINPISIK